LGLRLNLSQAEDDPSVGMRMGHTAIVTQLEVDTLLGKIRPLHVWNRLAVGKIFVPELATSQVYGGVIQGLGYALYEQKQYDLKTGHTLSSNLNDYRIPGIGDTPEIEVSFDEAGYEEIRGQGIGLAELATVGVAASVGNAVYHATGRRPLETPITPFDVVAGMKG
jgi:xanthine dehydrogenase YagR molybdenum-binding subunit